MFVTQDMEAKLVQTQQEAQLERTKHKSQVPYEHARTHRDAQEQRHA